MLFRNKTISSKRPNNLSKLRKVSFDSYGNAIPDVPSVKIEGSVIAATIVETRDILIPVRENTRVTKSKPVSLMKKLLPLVTWSPNHSSTVSNLPIKKEDAASAEIQYIPRQQHIAQQNIVEKNIPDQEIQTHKLSEFFELSFKKLRHEFDTREQQLEKQFQSLKQQNQVEISQLQVSKKKWFLPMVIASAIAGGYMLYILTNMQHSMKTMSASIPVMNQHIGNMAQDTQAMNQSMQHLNSNVGQMNNQVYQMNQQMGGISQSIKPIGDAAATTQPFLGMMRSFMPF